jgi:alkylation response protein AidB-like acyl-CoA dehydrogenase
MPSGMLLPAARPLPAGAAELRSEVRSFLAAERAAETFVPACDAWLSGWDESFSRRLAERGWVGMTIPPEYGGHGRSALDRYVVVEELLAAGAPVAAHWISDRQVGPNLLRYGSEALKQRYLPAIAQGACYFAIGLSEPDAGSDLAAVRTAGTRVEGGWSVSGTKIWTSGAHRAHALIALLRTGPPDGRQRHVGLSQLLIELDQPGVTIRPIISMTGEHHFNEVVFDSALLPASTLIGRLGDGWRQVTSELAYERSGPERFLSTFILLVELIRALGTAPGDEAVRAVGRLTAHLIVLRRLSRSVAAMLDRGEDPQLQAALVKDLGCLFEQEIPEIARRLVSAEPSLQSTRDFCAVLAYTLVNAPSFSLRGGTREILRGIIARGLGLR